MHTSRVIHLIEQEFERPHGVEHSEIVLRGRAADEDYLEELRADGWTVTKYVRADDD